MFLDAESDTGLSIPVCVTTEEREEQNKLSNKTVPVIKAELDALIECVLDLTQARAYRTDKRMKKGRKADLLALYVEIMEYVDEQCVENAAIVELDPELDISNF